jgi:uncharacterized protein (TIRG00374 family)
MSGEHSKQGRNRLLSWLINLSGVLILGLILYSGGIEAWQQIVRGDWGYVLAALAVTLLWNMVAAYRWSLVTQQVAGEPANFAYKYYFTYHMIGMVTGQVLPITIGMLGGRPAALSLSREVSIRRAALSVFLDKFFDLMLALLLVGPVALYLIDWIDLPLALGLMGGMVLFGAAVVGWKYEQLLRVVGRVASHLVQPLARIPVIGRRLVRRLPQQLERLSTETFLSNRSAARSFALTLVLYCLLSARLFFIAQALRLDIPWHLLAMGVCVTQLALIFSITPGSLGFLEGGWWAVLSLAGLTQEQYYYFIIGRRAYVLVFTVIGALLAFSWIRESPARLFRAVLTASRRPAQRETQKGSPSSAVK